MSDKINGILKLTTALAIIYLLTNSLYIGDNSLNVDFSTYDSSITTFGSYLAFLCVVNYILYFSISGVRQYKGLTPKYKIIYFIALLYGLFRGYILFQLINSFVNEEKEFSLMNIIRLTILVISIYSLTVDTIYQFRKNKL